MPRERPRITAAAPAAPRGRANNRPQVPFACKLVLNQWLLSLFDVKRFEDLAEHLRSEALEGLDENNVHHFHHALTAQLFNLTQLPTDLLLEYDQNLVKHTQRLNERRITRGEEPIVWKYFQYLTLLFTEIYLDRYFRDPRSLLKALNVQVAAYNAGVTEADQIAAFDEQADAWPQLNKLAYWSATGSGKTLLMHANMLQYQHYLEKHGRRRELNRIILLTPNEGLSQQHRREFEVAGIDAELFNKQGRGLFSGHAVEILEVTRLREEMGDRTIAIDAFEGNNLVLVDEGHRGASSGGDGAWMRFRNALCEQGFSFEYSATFGQAVKGNPKLTELYAKSTLFDYSYRYFYGDGFGKDYQILNLDEGTQANNLELYLVACLLSFFGVSTEFGDAFRKLGPVPTLARPEPVRDPSTVYLQTNQVVLNWYPKIQAMKSIGLAGGDADAAPNQTHLTARHLAFLDLDRLYFELERFKAERGWYNLNLTRAGLAALLEDQSWYCLLIPAEELAFDSFEKVRLWQEIALALLKKYTERYYTFRKREWEMPHLEYRDLEADDPNLLRVKEEPGQGYYRILIDRSQEEIVAKLEELKASIARGDLRPWEFRGLKAIWFGRHLYQPLLYLDTKIVEISPAPLNKGERQFVEDLKSFHDGAGAFFADKELYLLRNLSKGRGVGFFEAGNFHPDFILWLLVGGKQHVIFVDPKGIVHLGPTDPKIRFHETIKEIERRLGDASVRLQSFIVSNTPSHTMQMLWNMDKPAMEARHILFQEEDKASYIGAMLRGVALSTTA